VGTRNKLCRGSTPSPKRVSLNAARIRELCPRRCLLSGERWKKARQMAAHASTRTTQLYDRREDRVTLDEVVKINIRG
jgi:hypothetical protein